MNEEFNDQEDWISRKVKEDWDDLVESNSDRLEGLEEQVQSRIGGRSSLQPSIWLRRVKNCFVRLIDSLSPKQRYAVGGGVVAAVMVGLLVGWIISPSTGNGTAQVVTFQLPATNAQTVGLAGDFSGYKPLEMKDKNSDGVWTLQLKLKKGKYEYYYLINGKKKPGEYPLADEIVRDWKGSKNGIRFVGEEEKDESETNDYDV